MKKLVLAINSLLFITMMPGCRNTQPSKFQGATSESIAGDTTSFQDTTKVMMQSAPQGAVGESIGVNKDSLKQPVKSTAIIHNAPDQGKIDSIKNAKQKIKK